MGHVVQKGNSILMIKKAICKTCNQRIYESADGWQHANRYALDFGERHNAEPLPDGVPCFHPGCLSHITHACEGCGRVGGVSVDDFVFTDGHRSIKEMFFVSGVTLTDEQVHAIYKLHNDFATIGMFGFSDGVLRMLLQEKAVSLINVDFTND